MIRLFFTEIFSLCSIAVAQSTFLLKIPPDIYFYPKKLKPTERLSSYIIGVDVHMISKGFQNNEGWVLKQEGNIYLCQVYVKIGLVR